MDEDAPIAGPERITMSRAALRLELLEMEVRIKEFFNPRFTSIETDIRNLQEDARLAKERVLTEKMTLATETERRRTELADLNKVEEKRWTVRGHKAELFIGFAAIGSLAIGLVTALNTFFH